MCSHQTTSLYWTKLTGRLPNKAKCGINWTLLPCEQALQGEAFSSARRGEPSTFTVEFSLPTTNQKCDICVYESPGQLSISSYELFFPTQCLPWMSEKFHFLAILLVEISWLASDHVPLYTKTIEDRPLSTYFNKTSSLADQKALFSPRRDVFACNYQILIYSWRSYGHVQLLRCFIVATALHDKPFGF